MSDYSDDFPPENEFDDSSANDFNSSKEMLKASTATCASKLPFCHFPVF